VVGSVPFRRSDHRIAHVLHDFPIDYHVMLMSSIPRKSDFDVDERPVVRRQPKAVDTFSERGVRIWL